MDRKLLQFLTVAEMGNVSLAAEAMNVSQPTVSANLKRLEEDYGVALLSRSSRGVVLTEFGSILFEHARGMDRLNKHAAAEIHDLKSRKRPSVRFGCGHVWWPSIGKRAVEQAQADNDDVSWHVEICSSLEGIRGLLSGDLGVFLGTKVRQLSPGIALEFEPLFVTSDRFFAHIDHPLHGGPVQLDALKQYPRLDVAPYAASHFGIAEQDHDRLGKVWEGFRPAQFSANALATGLDLMQSGQAWLYYSAEAEPMMRDHDVRPLQVEGFAPIETEIGLYRLPEKRLTPQLGHFIDQLRRTAAEFRDGDVRK